MNELTDRQAELLLRHKDEEALFQIVMNDKRPNMHEQALFRLKDPAHLKAAALVETDGDLQYSLLIAIDDPDVNAVYAKAGADPEIRVIATERLHDQDLLYEIFSEADRHEDPETYVWEYLAYTAFVNIEDKAAWEKIAVDPSLHLNYREVAVTNITDRNLLDKLLTDKEETIAKAAVLKITDEKTLIKAACHHPFASVRLMALYKLSNESLVTLIENPPDVITRRHAVQQCNKMPQALARRLALSDIDVETRIGALNFVNRRDLIISIARYEQDDSLAYHAYQRLKKDLTEEEKWLLFKTALSSEVRFSIIRFSEDRDLLNFAAEHDPDESIRKRAAERLTYTFF